MRIKCFKEIKPKIFLLLLIVATSFLFYNRAVAETIRWQEFEYWDDPQNHGWVTSSYTYPSLGFGVGYGTMQTVVDFTQGSRVLKVQSSNPSVFNQMERFSIRNDNIFYLGSNNTVQPITNHPVISFDISERLGIEAWDQFEFQVGLRTRSGHYVVLGYCPVGIDENASKPALVSGSFPSGGNTANNPAYIKVNLGRQYQDGTWHMIIRDMNKDIGDVNSTQGFGGGSSQIRGSSQIQWIRIYGNSYKLDNIWFHTDMGIIANHPPKLQRIGPQFAQLFIPFNMVIEANDIDVSNPSPGNPELNFVATVGGWGAKGSASPNLITRVKLTNNPGPVTFRGKYVYPCSIDDPDVESNVVMFTYVPQYLEELTIAIRVSDRQGLSDVEVFPLSVVNYPVVNHPPILEELEDDFYLLGSGQPYEKYFSCYDQDYQKDINGKSDTAGIGAARGNITFTSFIDGLPYYGYGPYEEDLIPEPTIPHITFTPQFEGVHRIVVVARDTRGLSSIGEYTLSVVNPGTVYNHPPVLGEDIDSPQIAMAGQLFSIPLEFYDPDLEPLYYSCNVGQVTKLPPAGIQSQSFAGTLDAQSVYGRYRGGAVYTFMTYFTGTYYVQITAYDQRGAFTTAHFVLDVQPLWSL